MCVDVAIGEQYILGKQVSITNKFINEPHVSITNRLANNIDLIVRCKYGDDDIKVHVLYFDDSFGWTFQNNLFGTT